MTAIVVLTTVQIVWIIACILLEGFFFPRFPIAITSFL